jgi:hypothetical protein
VSLESPVLGLNFDSILAGYGHSYFWLSLTLFEPNSIKAQVPITSNKIVDTTTIRLFLISNPSQRFIELSVKPLFFLD